MKRILLFSVIYTIFAFCVSICVACFQGTPELFASDVFFYRLLTACKYFLDFVPALGVSGAMIGGTIEFSRFSSKCRYRFSDEILYLFGYAVKLSILLVLVMTISNEIFLPLVSAKRDSLRSDYLLYRDYLKWGEHYLEEGDLELALHYAQGISGINASSKEAQSFISRAETAYDVQEHKKGFILGADGIENKVENTKNAPFSIEALREKVAEASEKGDWFSAHYYANIAAEMEGQEKGGEQEWSALSIPYKSINAENYEEIFDVYSTKYYGYSALLNDDPITAYYTFKTLYDTSRSLADDPDIRQYLAKSEEALLKKYFFVDEMNGIEHFENVRNMYFSVKLDEGGTYIVFVQGVTDFSHGKYLRGLSVHKFDANGQEEYSMSVPYAKMFDTGNANTSIMVKSVYKENNSGIVEPVYTLGDGRSEKRSALFFEIPMPYNDFELVANAAVGADKMFLPLLMKFVRKSEIYGFSTESLRLILVERLCYPLLLFIIFIFCATFAWNYRVNKGDVFRFNWILTFPFMTFICYIAITCGLYALKLLATVIVGMVGVYALSFSLASCVFLLTAVSIFFLSRKSD